jgi:predicted NUDIX family NTP pyrophosphohydrolase
MPRTSAGILLYRTGRAGLEVLLVHPGGPFWKNKDDGAWSIPKGEVAPQEDLLAAARREFAEELGSPPPDDCVPLTPMKQKGGKIVHAFACRGDLDTAKVRSNTFSMEWPPGSGQLRPFPEVDRAEFFTLEVAARKILAGQIPLLEELERMAAKPPV